MSTYGWAGLLVIGAVIALLVQFIPIGGTVGRLLNVAAIICVVLGIVLLVLSLVGALA